MHRILFFKICLWLVALTFTSAGWAQRPSETPQGLQSGLTYHYYTGSFTVLPDFTSLTPVSMGNATDMKRDRTTLRREWTKLYNFIRGGNDSLSGLRRETMFIQILEGLHPLDAEILCLMKDKKLYDKYKITKENVIEAYPDIVWGVR